MVALERGMMVWVRPERVELNWFSKGGGFFLFILFLLLLLKVVSALLGSVWMDRHGF